MGSHHPIRKAVPPEPTVIPDKLYFRIGDVARLCQVPAYVLRFWETEFPSLKPNKGGTGQRLYRKRDVEMALRIKSLLYDQGYTIPGARQVFKAEARAPEPAAASVPEAPTAPSLAAPALSVTAPLDRGEEIRLRAQQQPHLQALRKDLLALLTQLSIPVAPIGSPAGPTGNSLSQLGSPVNLEAPASLRPVLPPAAEPPTSESSGSGLRPRLVLEPRPPGQRAQVQAAKPEPAERQQRDLFAFDTPEIPE